MVQRVYFDMNGKYRLHYVCKNRPGLKINEGAYIVLTVVSWREIGRFTIILTTEMQKRLKN